MKVLLLSHLFASCMLPLWKGWVDSAGREKLVLLSHKDHVELLNLLKSSSGESQPRLKATKC